MKTAERYLDDDGKIVRAVTYDAEPYLQQAAALRAAECGDGENKLVGRIPAFMATLWLKEAGVSWDDPAADDVIKKKMLNGEFSKFRVWGGTY